MIHVTIESRYECQLVGRQLRDGDSSKNLDKANINAHHSKEDEESVLQHMQVSCA